MYILTDKTTGGVYAVLNKDQKKIVQIFEEWEDAERYSNLLEADEYEDDLDIVEVDVATVAQNCDSYGYFYAVITKDDFIIPPKL